MGVRGEGKDEKKQRKRSWKMRGERSCARRDLMSAKQRSLED
jgi:hypothetical protein